MAISGVERVQMVKNRDIKGALATDHALREVVEKRVSDHSTLGTHTFDFVLQKFCPIMRIRENSSVCQVNDNEIVLCDLESRQVCCDSL